MAVCLSVREEQWQVWREIDHWREEEGLVLCEECNGEAKYPEDRVAARPSWTEKA